MMQFKNIIVVIIFLFVLCTNLSADVDSDFEQKINSLKWIAYFEAFDQPWKGY